METKLLADQIEHCEVRLEYLRYRAKYHLEEERDATNQLDKVNHWRMFSMYNYLLIQEKDKYSLLTNK